MACIPASNIFIEAGLEAGGVLVHCLGGRSRSAALIAAYLMSSYGWSYDFVLSKIRSIRTVASINKGFENQLRAYFDAGFNVYAAQQILLRHRMRMIRSLRGQIGDRNEKCSSKPKLRSSGHKRSWDGDQMDIQSENESDDDDTAEASISISEDCAASKVDDNSPKMGIQHSVIPALDCKSPHCKFSRPGSSSIHIIPPLRGLERQFCCVKCSIGLFHLSNVIKMSEVPALKAESKLFSSKQSVYFESFGEEEVSRRSASSSKNSSSQTNVLSAPTPRRGPSQPSFGFMDLTDSTSLPTVTPRSRSLKAFDFEIQDQMEIVSESQSSALSSIISSTGLIGDIAAGASTGPTQSQLRPPSAEKRKWLARISLLGGIDSTKSNDGRISKIAADDEFAATYPFGDNPTVYLEYLEWMGPTIFDTSFDRGDIGCPRCAAIVGNWNWLPECR